MRKLDNGTVVLSNGIHHLVKKFDRMGVDYQIVFTFEDDKKIIDPYPRPRFERWNRRKGIEEYEAFAKGVEERLEDKRKCGG